jgi:hypothetical protein
MPRDPTSRTPLLRLPGMRRADAPGLGRTNPEVRRNVPRLRRLLTPKIGRRRQPTEALMMMTTEECHPEEMQAFATRRPADEGPTHYSPRGLSPRLSRSFYSRGCPVRDHLGRALPRLDALDFPTLTSKSTTLGRVALLRQWGSWVSSPLPRRLPPFRKKRGKDAAPHVIRDSDLRS